jgi:integrase
MSRTAAAAASPPPRPTVLRGRGAQVEVEYASDHWHADRLGVPARRGRSTARFDTITQPWLRDPVKRWSRVRLATGCAFSTISSGALGLARFSAFLSKCHPEVADETAITRPVLEDYLSWLVTMGYSAATRALSLSFIRVFFDACHRHGWLPGLSANSVIYVEELPYHHDQVARFIPEFVMGQLETDTALDRLPNTTARNLVVVLMETGLRIGDACTLEFSPMVDDSVGWPCLRFDSTKVRAEQLIPLSAKAAEAIRSQQDHDRRTWSAGTPWLFPAVLHNADGSKPYAAFALSTQLRRWQTVIDVRDEAGEPFRVTAHRFRHTLGTRLKMSDVAVGASFGMGRDRCSIWGLGSSVLPVAG